MTFNHDMSEAPRDGSLLLLLIEAGEERDNALDDTAGPSRTVGFNNFVNDGEDKWLFAGWCWSDDHFTEGAGKPIAWALYPYKVED